MRTMDARVITLVQGERYSLMTARAITPRKLSRESVTVEDDVGLEPLTPSMVIRVGVLPNI